MGRCIITGCTLSIPEEGKVLHGDLHQMYDDGFVFNGVQEPGSNVPGWEYRELLPGEMALIIPGDYFELRAVVIPEAQSGAYLNTPAVRYVNGEAPLEEV